MEKQQYREGDDEVDMRATAEGYEKLIADAVRDLGVPDAVVRAIVARTAQWMHEGLE
jgi:hypothetical protein